MSDKKIYCKIEVADITEEIFEKAIHNNIYTIRKTNDLIYGMLKFNECDVPVGIYHLGLTLLSHTEARAEVAKAEWN